MASVSTASNQVIQSPFHFTVLSSPSGSLDSPFVDPFISSSFLGPAEIAASVVDPFSTGIRPVQSANIFNLPLDFFGNNPSPETVLKKTRSQVLDIFAGKGLANLDVTVPIFDFGIPSALPVPDFSALGSNPEAVSFLAFTDFFTQSLYSASLPSPFIPYNQQPLMFNGSGLLGNTLGSSNTVSPLQGNSFLSSLLSSIGLL